MTKNPKNLWHNVDGDPLGDVDPDANAPGLNYLCADMDEIAEGVDAASLVWLRLLQLRRMRPRDEYVLLGQDWLTRHGVSRYAKYRALEKFERQKLIRVIRSPHRGPRVKLLARQRKSAHLRSKSAHLRVAKPHT